MKNLPNALFIFLNSEYMMTGAVRDMLSALGLADRYLRPALDHLIAQGVLRDFSPEPIRQYGMFQVLPPRNRLMALHDALALAFPAAAERLAGYIAEDALRNM